MNTVPQRTYSGNLQIPQTSIIPSSNGQERATRAQAIAALSGAPAISLRADVAELPRGKRERTFQHYLTILQLCLDQLDTPEGFHEFIIDLFCVLGFGAADEFIPVYDDRIAEMTCPSMSKREAKKQRLRRQRRKLFAWQEETSTDGLRFPALIEWSEIRDPDSQQSHYEYKMPIAALVREIVETCPIGTRSAKLQPALVRSCGQFVASQRAKKRPLRRKREVSAESDFNRAETLAKNAFEKQAKLENDASARARLEAMILRLQGLLRGGCDQNDHTPPLENLTPDETRSAGVSGEVEDAFINTCVSKSGGELSADVETQEAPPSRTFGQSRDEFIHQAELARRENWKREREERLASYFSLAELERFDPRAGGRSKTERDFYCPACDPSKKHNRSLSINTHTGAYVCHRCQVEGCLRERCEDMTSNGLPLRHFSTPSAPAPKQTEPNAEQQVRANQARRIFDKAPKASEVRIAAEYLIKRGIPLDAADRCGVRYASHQGRKAVVFPFVNRVGEIVAINDRRVDSDEHKTRTTGPKSLGVFATPGALDAEQVLIVESPLDAVVVYAAGLDAIAVGGTSWPEWLLELLEGRRVLLGFDNDDTGAAATVRLGRELCAGSMLERLAPSAKDWLEIAETKGLHALREELASALFAEEADELEIELEEVSF
jgi:hypothetical protein